MISSRRPQSLMLPRPLLPSSLPLVLLHLVSPLDQYICGLCDIIVDPLIFGLLWIILHWFSAAGVPASNSGFRTTYSSTATSSLLPSMMQCPILLPRTTLALSALLALPSWPFKRHVTNIADTCEYVARFLKPDNILGRGLTFSTSKRIYSCLNIGGWRTCEYYYLFLSNAIESL